MDTFTKLLSHCVFHSKLTHLVTKWYGEMLFILSSENCGEESTQVKLLVSAKKKEKIVWSSRGREENNKMEILLWKETLKM